MALPDSIGQLIAQQTQTLELVGGLGAAVQAAMAGGGEVDIYVDALAGSDTNTGVPESPLKTIAKALSIAPQGRSVWINLVGGAVYDINYSDAPNGKLAGEGCALFFCPAGRKAAGPAWVATAANTPTIRFNTVSQGGQNLCGYISGPSSVAFWALTVIYPSIVDAGAGTASLVAIGGNPAGFLNFSHSSCTIVLGSGPAIANTRAMLLVQVNNCVVSIAAGTPAGTARLVNNAGLPMVISWLAVTLPSGVTLGSLITNNGATLSGVAADNAPLSNLSSF